MSSDRIRVWLEPGYDRGRFGAWMLDLPGCFVWRDGREAAISAAAPRAQAFVRWLADHGEVAPFDVAGGEETDIIEEVAATSDGDYERNVTFAADRRSVPSEELKRTLRWLDLARADLLPAIGRLRAKEASTGPLPTAGADRTERESDEMLRHLAGAEIWLAGRLDRSARYDGPAREGDVVTYLGATRAWANARVRELHRRDPELAGTDGEGETWTLAKVLRRLVYHSLDHLDEQDRRLRS